MILCVKFEMFRQLRDSARQQRHLYVGAASVLVMQLEFFQIERLRVLRHKRARSLAEEKVIASGGRCSPRRCKARPNKQDNNRADYRHNKPGRMKSRSRLRFGKQSPDQSSKYSADDAEQSSHDKP